MTDVTKTSDVIDTRIYWICQFTDIADSTDIIDMAHLLGKENLPIRHLHAGKLPPRKLPRGKLYRRKLS